MKVKKFKTKNIKYQGKGNNPNAAAAITTHALDKLYDAKQLGSDNSSLLKNSMWYTCTTYFGMTSGTEVHVLCSGDIELCCTDDGTEYLVYNPVRQTKTRSGADPRDTRKIKPRA